MEDLIIFITQLFDNDIYAPVFFGISIPGLGGGGFKIPNIKIRTPWGKSPWAPEKGIPPISQIRTQIGNFSRSWTNPFKSRSDIVGDIAKSGTSIGRTIAEAGTRLNTAISRAGTAGGGGGGKGGKGGDSADDPVTPELDVADQEKIDTEAMRKREVQRRKSLGKKGRGSTVMTGNLGQASTIRKTILGG